MSAKGAPKFRQVELASLRVDSAYQRNLNRARATRIAKDYNPFVFGALAVNERRAGQLYVFDGQHRLEAARILGMEKVPCLVYSGMSRQEEALAFYHLDTKRVSLHAMDAFRALILARDKDALAVDRIVRSCGFTFETGAARYLAPRRIAAVHATQEIYAKGGEEALRTTLELIDGVWPLEENMAARPILLGVGRFYLKHRERLDMEHLQEVLREFSPMTLYAAAKAITTAMTSNSAHGGGVLIAIEDRYNSRAHRKRGVSKLKR